MTVKIAYLCGSVSWGGLEMNQLKNARWMAQRGHAVLMLCQQDSPLFTMAKSANLEVVTIPPHKKYYDFKAGKTIAKQLDELNVTHLIIRSTADMSVAVIAKRKSKQAIHLSYFMEMQLGVKKRNLLHTIRFSYLDLWSCPLHYLAEQVRTMTRFDKHKIKVIPSGVELAIFQTQIPQSLCRTRLNLPTDKICIGLIGRFDPQKGQLVLLDAFEKLNNPNLHLCFLGESTKGEAESYTKELVHRIANSSLNSHISILPFRNDVETFYKAIDMLVMATKAETFGMVTVEAIASGTPVVASNAGGSPEILKQGELGTLFESGNSVDLARAISTMLDKKLNLSPIVLVESAKVYCHLSVCDKVENILGISSK